MCLGSGIGIDLLRNTPRMHQIYEVLFHCVNMNLATLLNRLSVYTRNSPSTPAAISAHRVYLFKDSKIHISDLERPEFTVKVEKIIAIETSNDFPK